MEVMFEIPSQPKVRKCVVSEETVRERIRPELLAESGSSIDYGDFPTSVPAVESEPELEQESA